MEIITNPVFTGTPKCYILKADVLLQTVTLAQWFSGYYPTLPTDIPYLEPGIGIAWFNHYKTCCNSNVNMDWEGVKESILNAPVTYSGGYDYANPLAFGLLSDDAHTCLFITDPKLTTYEIKDWITAYIVPLVQVHIEKVRARRLSKIEKSIEAFIKEKERERQYYAPHPVSFRTTDLFHL